MHPAINVFPLLCLIIHICLLLLCYSTALPPKTLFRSGLKQALWAACDIVNARFRGLIQTGATHARRKKYFG